MENSGARKPRLPASLILLDGGREWGFTIGFFLLFAAVAFFFIKLANGDFAEWTLSMWGSTKRYTHDGDDDTAFARPLLSDDTHGDHEVVEL